LSLTLGFIFYIFGLFFVVLVQQNKLLDNLLLFLISIFLFYIRFQFFKIRKCLISFMEILFEIRIISTRMCSLYEFFILKLKSFCFDFFWSLYTLKFLIYFMWIFRFYLLKILFLFKISLILYFCFLIHSLFFVLFFHLL